MITISWTAIIIILVVWAFIIMFNHFLCVEKYKEALKAPKFPISHKVASAEVYKLRMYLKGCMKDRPEEDRKMFDYYLEKSEPILGTPCEAATLFRLLHMLGGEMVARQTDTKDIEVEENKGDAYWEYYTDLADKSYKFLLKNDKSIKK